MIDTNIKRWTKMKILHSWTRFNTSVYISCGFICYQVSVRTKNVPNAAHHWTFVRGKTVMSISSQCHHVCRIDSCLVNNSVGTNIRVTLIKLLVCAIITKVNYINVSLQCRKLTNILLINSEGTSTFYFVVRWCLMQPSRLLSWNGSNSKKYVFWEKCDYFIGDESMSRGQIWDLSI